jgi:hypothetical protein
MFIPATFLLEPCLNVANHVFYYETNTYISSLKSQKPQIKMFKYKSSQNIKNFVLGWGYHSGDHEEFYLLGYNAV